GHSFGGAVAMKAAEALGPRVDKLILFEPNPFYLLKQHGRDEAFAEISGVAATVSQAQMSGDWEAAAEMFADYWGGSGSWAALSEQRRGTFVEFLRPNFFEWDAVINETKTLGAWAECLPVNTVVISTEHTVRPIREIAELMREGCPGWRFEHLGEVGHMAPLTRPDLVNPLLASLLLER
ncbi:MAG: alpha/beta hydrolase, partial [Pseudomonadota bacterium]